MWSSLVIALEFFVCAIPLHIMVCRLTSTYKFVSKSLVLGIFVLLFLCGYEHQTNNVDLISLYMFSTLWLGYLLLIFNLMKSTTLKMLDVLSREPHGELHLNEFTQFFYEDEGLKNRIFSMKSNGFIFLKRDKLFLSQRAERILVLVQILRRLFALDKAS